MIFHQSLGRRSWLKTAFASTAVAPAPVAAQTFHHHNVLGTSLEMQVRGKGSEAAWQAALAEVRRLDRILSTYDPRSEISRWIAGGETGTPHPEVRRILDLYESWQTHTEGAISSRLPSGRNINALGKSYILDRALGAAHRAAPEATAMLLNIGGDIATIGGPWQIGIANPNQHHDNAPPLVTVSLTNAAITTSGSYERGPDHMIDPRSGTPARGAGAATVIAPNAVIANALATALCVLDAATSQRLVANLPGIHALAIDHNGSSWATAHFPAPPPVLLRNTAGGGWPKGQQVTITLTLKAMEGYRVRRPYVAVWAEDKDGKVVRNIAVWSERRRWLPDLFEWWKKSGSSGGGASVTRATRPPGRYQLLWDGLDDAGQPLPEGSYRIVVESNREHGSYAKESGVIVCGKVPARAVLKENSEFAAVEVNYGPSGNAA